MPRFSAFGPISFRPIFFERIWGGQNLATLYGKDIPRDRLIGESWEIVDRPEAQSVVSSGTLAGRSLHDLWINFHTQIFGNAPDTPRFPLLIKLLDCSEKLSLQVHPPPSVAAETGGEPKTECWYVADASPQAELFMGLRAPIARESFRDAVISGKAEDLVHRVSVKTGDTFFIPSGRLHAIGGGNLIVEVQQNSDTTYRVFDWNRRDEQGQLRQLHLDEAITCINFNDCQPTPLRPDGERILSHELFSIERWQLETSRETSRVGTFAIIFCLTGSLECGGTRFKRGDFFLLPADSERRTIEALEADTSVLRVTLD